MSINTIITTLLTQLSKISPPPAPPNPDYNINNINDNNIFTNLSATDTRQLKNLLLTLHCLFPNELLLALDILDRGFVRRYTYTSTSITANNKSDTKKIEEEDTLIFIVQSTSSPSNLEREREREGSDGGGEGGGNAYQVHLKTWNCSCPAFVLGCFAPAATTTNTANAEERQEENNDMDAKEESWFGGTLRIPDSSYDDQSIPVCKHILACVLVAKCPGLFGRKCLTYEVNDMGKINEVAGWCAA